jgi:hypothetical protein
MLVSVRCTTLSLLYLEAVMHHRRDDRSTRTQEADETTPRSRLVQCTYDDRGSPVPRDVTLVFQ